MKSIHIISFLHQAQNTTTLLFHLQSSLLVRLVGLGDWLDSWLVWFVIDSVGWLVWLVVCMVGSVGLVGCLFVWLVPLVGWYS